MTLNTFHVQKNITADNNVLLRHDLWSLGEHLKAIDEKWNYHFFEDSISSGLGFKFKITYENKKTFIFTIKWDLNNGWETKSNYTPLKNTIETGSLESWRCVLYSNMDDPPTELFSSITKRPCRYYYKKPYDVFINPQNQYSQYLHWGIGLTGYGAMLTIPFFTDNEIENISPSSVDCFFFNVENATNKEDNSGAILMNMGIPPVDETAENYAIDTDGSQLFLAIGNHTQLERIPSDYFSSLRNRGELPVLVNLCSKETSYYAPHLYIKETAHENCFGHIKLEDTYFLAGSGFCLETTEGKE